MNENIVYCGFGVYYDTSTNERFEKTASDKLSKISDGAQGLLERDYINGGLEKAAMSMDHGDKGGKYN